MKNYIALERYTHHFYPVQDDLFEDLRYLVDFLSTDYRCYDKRFLKQSLSFYNSSFIYHNFIDKNLHIGFSEWEIRLEVPVPCDSAFPNFVNSSNSCKIHLQNFNEFIKIWLDMKKLEKSFALVYRNENDWIICKGFDSKEELDCFIAN